VWRNARRLGVAPAALDDVTQDVFLVAHRRLGELSRPESLRAWIFSIVIRVVRDYRRTLRRKDPQQRSAAPLLDPDQLPDTRAANPQAAAERTDAVRMLYSMLNELDDAKREVFVLAELEEMTELENLPGARRKCQHGTFATESRQKRLRPGGAAAPRAR